MKRPPAALVHLALALAVTWPTVLSPLSRMAGHPDGDVWNHAWGPWWFWQELSQGNLPWHSDQLFGPDGGTLWFIDPISALLGAPLVPLLGVAGAWNAVVIAGVAFSSWAARLLATRVTGAGDHTWIASVALVFGPYLNGELHNGISEAALLGPGLLSLALAWSAFSEGGLRRWLETGAALGLTFLGSPYYALAAGLAITGWSVPWLWQRPSREQKRGAAAGAALTAALTAPVALAVRASVTASDALVHRADPGVVDLVLAHNRVDPRTFVAPLGFQSVDYAALGESFLHSGYVGWIVLALALRGWQQTGLTRFALGGLLTLVFALGPVLMWGEAPLEVGGRRLLLPFSALAAVVPVQVVTHTLRLAVPGLAIVAVLAAVAVRNSPRWLRPALLLIPLELVTLGGSAWPLARTPTLDTSAQAFLASQPESPGRTLVLDLPGAVGNTMATSRYLVLQAEHGRAIPYRPDARASSASLLAVPTFQLLALASESRQEHRAMLGPAVASLQTVDREDLARAGVSHVLVHRDLARGGQRVAETEQLLEQLYGPPDVHGTTAIYTVTGSGRVGLDPALRTALSTLN
jgi:hypothetical protein